MTTRFPLAWPDGWPRTVPARRERSKFRTGYHAAYENLKRQFSLLGASEIIVSSNAPLRRDGNPYQDAMTDQLDDPGCAVYFRLKGEPRVMARDAYLTPAENLHSIGHVIEHLRGIERHGGSYMMSRAFSAFAALPAPSAARHWREVLGIQSGAVRASDIEAAHIARAKICHPDMPGGSHDAMVELNRARDQALREIGGAQ